MNLTETFIFATHTGTIAPDTQNPYHCALSVRQK